jgi:3-oxoacyl-[acyl-carrier-protein] synthase II
MRRVAITGLGLVSPNGIGKKAFWHACVNGQSGVGAIRSFDAHTFPVRLAAEVPPFDVNRFLPAAHRKCARVMARATRFGVAAAMLAVEDSGLNVEQEDGDQIGVVMGTGPIPVDLAEMGPALGAACDDRGQFQAESLGRLGADSIPPGWVLKYLPNMVAAQISLMLNARGPNSTITTACTAGTQAIGEASRLVARGDADIVLAGGADSRIDPLWMMAYARLGILSQADRPPAEVCRPFDAERGGIVLGEGAAVLVLEEFERARTRGAVIYGELLGMGSSFDACSLTKPDPQGRGAARAIELALREARTNAADGDYVSAHGTGTLLNDVMETRAVKRVFGEGAQLVPMSSIKSMIGHLMGAAGAVEAAALALTVHEGVVPPTINLTRRDPSCDLDYVPQCAREVPVRTALSTSFGLGGQNAAIVMRRC